AEDGIRDRNVTGVQTCALPILDFGDLANEVQAGLPWERAAHQPSREASGSQDQLTAVHCHRMHPDEQSVRAGHGNRSRPRIENLRWSVTLEERRAHLGHNRLQGWWFSPLTPTTHEMDAPIHFLLK